VKPISFFTRKVYMASCRNAEMYHYSMCRTNSRCL